jgi:hypothetical protein
MQSDRKEFASLRVRLDGARAAEGKSGGVLAFLKSEALHPADFTIREDGVVRLNPELGKRVAGLALCNCSDAQRSTGTLSSQLITEGCERRDGRMVQLVFCSSLLCLQAKIAVLIC